MVSWHGMLARMADVPQAIAALLRTMHYRRVLRFDPTARVLPTGRVLNPNGREESITLGAHSILRGEIFVLPHAGRVSIGAWCFIGEGTRIWSSAQVTIGDRVLISHNVNIHDTNAHPIDAEARHRQFKDIVLRGHPHLVDDIVAAPIVIGDDAWIGFGTTILKGVKIGQGAVVAACSVVTKDVPAWTVAGGNPARVLRELPHG